MPRTLPSAAAAWPAGDAPALPLRRRLLAAALAAGAAPWANAAPADDLLPAGWAALLAGTGLPPGCIGLQVQAVQPTSLPLARCNAERPYQLASTAKIITALAALDLLGGQYRWRTAACLGGPLHGGRLDGNLVIVGGGDAALRSADLLQWFGQMRAQGLQEIAGDIVLDRQAFRLSEQAFASTPTPGLDRPHHAHPDALTLDEGVLRVALQRGAGGRMQVSLQPPLAGLEVDPAVDDSAARGGGCNVEAAWAEAPSGQPRLQLRGRFGGACAARELALSPLSHAQFTLRAVGALWQAAGGVLRGRVIDHSPEPTPWPALTSVGHSTTTTAGSARPTPWLVHQSEPLARLLRGINKHSDNLAARNLMLSLSPNFPRQPATLASAHARVADWLRRQGLGAGDIAVDSGCGLSRDERGRPRAMVHLLRRAWASSHGRTFVESLPVAGVDGTLAHRMTSGPAAGRAFLKTGTLLDTRALAGYVLGASGTPYALVALVNHPEAQRATPALDAMVEWVAVNG